MFFLFKTFGQYKFSFYVFSNVINSTWFAEPRFHLDKLHFKSALVFVCFFNLLLIYRGHYYS